MQNLKKPWYVHHFNHSLFPLFLMVICPQAALLMWFICTHLQGSVWQFVQLILQEGLGHFLYTLWAPVYLGSAIAWKIIGVFAFSQLILMRIVPGKRFEGPITPMGNIPVYKANGFLCFIITLALFFVSSLGLHLFDPAIVYDHFGEILGALNIFSLVFCLFLYLKGRFFPSSTDCGTSGNLIFDYYWGTELYPRVLGWDLKMFTNCRFGMMSWPVIICSFAIKQAETTGLSDSMLVSVLIMLVYIGKFFWWETGYLRSIDIMHDRAGFYICWGCLVWVPAIYTSPALYLVNHPVHLGLALSLLIAMVGVGSVLINYLADRQRQEVRKANGECLVWGKKAEFIRAPYQTETGETKTSLLLTSGWWSLARHFHYLPELLGALCWTLPALFFNVLPYFYFVFLLILLVHRSFRDDEKCSGKYGQNWKAYCEKVPYRILPGLRSKGFFTE